MRTFRDCLESIKNDKPLTILSPFGNDQEYMIHRRMVNSKKREVLTKGGVKIFPKFAAITQTQVSESFQKKYDTYIVETNELFALYESKLKRNEYFTVRKNDLNEIVLESNQFDSLLIIENGLIHTEDEEEYNKYREHIDFYKMELTEYMSRYKNDMESLVEKLFLP